MTVAGASHVADLDPFDLLDAEAMRVGGFFDTLDDAGWAAPTRAAGWSVRDMLAHVDAIEVYHRACLDDDLESFMAEASKLGASLDEINDASVEQRRGRPIAGLLASWRAGNGEVRRRLRERGRDGSMASSVGPYPAGLMAFHIASEYATHADDMHVEIPGSERAARVAWRLRVSRFALEEASKPVEVDVRGDDVRVRSGGKETTLSAHDFVEAVTGRLPDDHPVDAELRDALRALA